MVESDALRVKRSSPYRTAFDRVRLVFRSLWFFDRILILKKQIVPAEANGSMKVSMHSGNVKRIANICRSTGQGVNEERIRRRLEKGMQFYSATLLGQPAASTWLLPPGQRFVDEIGYALVVPKDSLWIRDIYVADWIKGRQLFASFLDQILNKYHPDVHCLWSDTEVHRKASVKAHRNHGFEVVGTLRVMHVAGMLMLRTLPAEPLVLAGGFKPEARMLFTGRRYQDYKAAHLA